MQAGGSQDLIMFWFGSFCIGDKNMHICLFRNKRRIGLPMHFNKRAARHPHYTRIMFQIPCISSAVHRPWVPDTGGGGPPDQLGKPPSGPSASRPLQPRPSQPAPSDGDATQRRGGLQESSERVNAALGLEPCQTGHQSSHFFQPAAMSGAVRSPRSVGSHPKQQEQQGGLNAGLVNVPKKERST